MQKISECGLAESLWTNPKQDRKLKFSAKSWNGLYNVENEFILTTSDEFKWVRVQLQINKI